jgi:transposase-like protein
MTNSKRPYKTFTREFKLEAVSLMTDSNRPTAEIAAELGIRRNQLYKWKEQMEKIENVIVEQANNNLLLVAHSAERTSETL